MTGGSGAPESGVLGRLKGALRRKTLGVPPLGGAPAALATPGDDLEGGGCMARLCIKARAAQNVFSRG